MKLLLDSHSFLWFIMGDERLSVTARELIEDEANEPLLSAASVWEMAIKHSLGRLPTKQPFHQFIPQQLAQNGIPVLEISAAHACEVAALPFHHRDPFDRLLVAQSKVEQLPIVSTDAQLDAYGINRLW